MTITASMVKELRERTGAGMMECKKALQEANGDMEAAITAMRKSGQAKAAKRAGRIAAEGAVSIAINSSNNKAALVEVNCETDFVARDEGFKEFTSACAARALETNANVVADLAEVTYQDGSDVTIEQTRQDLVTKIGENIQLRRVAVLESKGIVGTYKHGNRIGVLVALDKDDAELAKDLAMHIAALNPQAISESDLPSEVIVKEKEIFIAQAKETGKPDNIIEKMVTGRIAKFVKEVCLVGQPFVKDPDQTIEKLLKEKNAKVLAFVRFEVGEGIEKETVDFAEEVRAQVEGR